MKVLEIFHSIDGEGTRAGELATFVRFAGCNLHCKYCFGEYKDGRYPLLTLPDLTKKPINEIEVGEEILTISNGKVVKTKVTDKFSRDVNEWQNLQFNNDRLIVTGEHPFSVEGKWVKASDLKVGDKCWNATPKQYSEYLIQQHLEELVSYTKLAHQLYLESLQVNGQERNGNFNSNLKERNFGILKKAISKGLVKQDIIAGTECENLVVHHLDGNHDNDSLENLVIVSNEFHNQLHCRGKNFWNKNSSVKPLEGIVVVANHKSFPRIQNGYRGKKVFGISCAPFNTYLINDILVHNCDTAYSINPKPEAVTEMSVNEIFDKVKFPNVTLTGGEPMMQKGIEELAMTLAAGGHKVNIETNGTFGPFTLPQWLADKVFFTVDYKCGASGCEDKMRPEVFQALRFNDVIKCVVGSVDDLENALKNLRKWVPYLGGVSSPYVYFSPVFGKIEPRQIVEFMKEKKLFGKYRVQLQLHKFIWEPNARMV